MSRLIYATLCIVCRMTINFDEYTCNLYPVRLIECHDIAKSVHVPASRMCGALSNAIIHITYQGY